MTMKNSTPPDDLILLVDDDQALLKSLERALREEGFSSVVTCSDPRDIESVASGREPAVVLLDLVMPHISGEALLQWFVAQRPDMPVIVITAVDDVDSAVRCIKGGAFDYLVKPIDFARLLSALQRALESRRLRLENENLKRRITAAEPDHPEYFDAIVTVSPLMKGVFRYIEAVATSDEPVLIIGETGTGKELIAEAVHRASGRKGQFVRVNIAGVDAAAFADTLFGHVRGAFTGADRAREGLIERAADGSILLDEIGDLSSDLQAKLLRLIQEREFFPLGSDRPVKSRARVIAVTNKDLRQRVRDGRFREDLFFRLHAHTIRVPTLRERPEDIPVLVTHFLQDAAKMFGKPCPTPPKELFAYLAAYPFPGNVRELRSMVVDAVACHDRGMLSLRTFFQHMDDASAKGFFQPAAVQSQDRISVGTEFPSLREATIYLFREALRRSNGNQSLAARMLGVSRRTINRYVTAGLLENSGSVWEREDSE